MGVRLLPWLPPEGLLSCAVFDGAFFFEDLLLLMVSG
jgi:hypothetical protein